MQEKNDCMECSNHLINYVQFLFACSCLYELTVEFMYLFIIFLIKLVFIELNCVLCSTA